MKSALKRLRQSFNKSGTSRPDLEPGFRQMDGCHYHDVLRQIETILKPQWYLEIGSRSGTSIAHRRCNFVAVDPVFAIKSDVFHNAQQMHFMQMTSDDFFASGFLGKLRITPDWAFIDGMHLFEFALRDFMNAEKAMAPDGLIALHDVCPYSHAMEVRQPAPDNTLKGWTGDVWKTMVVLKELRPDLQIDLLTAHSTGLGVVRGLDPNDQILTQNYEAAVAKYKDMRLSDFGVEQFFDTFGLTEPEDFLADLRTAQK
jgi:hypothetical protein